MDPLSAFQVLEQFAATRGEPALRLAMHAAVPQGFRIELLPLIRRNFMQEFDTSPSVDADLIFAPVCEPLGAGYFRFDSEVRRILIEHLEHEYESDARPRVTQMAALLLAYVEQVERRPKTRNEPALLDYLELQRWVALGFLDPNVAAEQLAAVLEGRGEDKAAARARIGEVAAALALPLAGYRGLIDYTLGVDALDRGDTAGAERRLEQFGDQPMQVGSVTLPSARAVLRGVGGGPVDPVERTTSDTAEELHLTSSPSLAIPDNSADGVRDTIHVTRDCTIVALQVRLEVIHSYVGDLHVALLTPQGGELLLQNRSGASQHNIDRSYDAQTVPALASLVGQSARGSWTLVVRDLASGDVGVFKAWELHLRVLEAHIPESPTPEILVCIYPNGNLASWLGVQLASSHRVQVLDPGAQYDELSRRALESPCIIVLWTEHTIADSATHEVARHALARNALVPVLGSPVEPPAPFSAIPAIDMTEWREGRQLTRLTFAVRECLDPSSVREELAGVLAPTWDPVRILYEPRASDDATFAHAQIRKHGIENVQKPEARPRPGQRHRWFSVPTIVYPELAARAVAERLRSAMSGRFAAVAMHEGSVKRAALGTLPLDSSVVVYLPDPHDRSRVEIIGTVLELAESREVARRTVEAAGLRAHSLEDEYASSRVLAQRLQDIAEADLVVVLIGSRYGFVPAGSENPDKKSVTWLEYDRALYLHIPVLVFVFEDEEIAQRQEPALYRAQQQFIDYLMASHAVQRVRTLKEFEELLSEALFRQVEALAQRS